MSRIITGILFFLVFFGAYGGIHYYTFTRLSNFFGLKRSSLFYLTILLLTVSYMIATFIMNRYDSLLTNSLYQAASLWFGIIFLLFWIVIAADILSRITTIPHHTLGMLALSLTLILSTIAIINTRDLKITTYDIEMEGLAEEVRIAHLSDLHIGTIYHADHLQKIVSLTNSLNPDIVAITGDLFDSSWHKNGGSMNILNKLHADTYFSTGNHEYYEGIDIIE